MKLFLILTYTCAFADTVTLRSGEKVEGTFLGGDARTVRVASGERVRTIAISDIDAIRFGASPGTSAKSGLQPREGGIFRPDRAITNTVATPLPAIPAGTEIHVRMIDAVDSDKDSVGTKFRASLQEPIVVDGKTIAPKGADVMTILLDNKQSGKFTGKTELTIDIVSVRIAGRDVELVSSAITRESASQTGSTAKKTGGGAAIGAIVGAIAGGGKGAAIGAAAGGGAGAASQIWTKGQRVRIPSETRLTFVLQETLKL